ncbi:MAG TPA: dienelactone hydrolase family protein [Streptosporangiaceae bacterium]|nr:dienelactone hydrolase family protein [Streptosporangiaceae bacterium]
MAQVVVFHSSYGLRQVEAGTAARLRDAGHQVLTPDLYAGQTAGSLDAALRLMDAIGWEVICERARQALGQVPGPAVLAGFSMGAGVIGSVWDQCRQIAGVVLLHGIAPIPASARPGLPVQVHLAENDPFASRHEAAQWQAGAAGAGLAAQVFTYPGAGHFYTDSHLADYHAQSASLTWQRVTAFLGGLSTERADSRGG